ncbi:hypothetical protein F511_22193 [Dorcoceras hygrometricum]|uniref:Uncharacterized protein n=1 Tax=Dorcoceras hygrometricum TaxID=472368 RepID=A0A2Z7CK10_9LAMI|nr:hypothetical protein F511_22193 [Dorcoceras hygrometricum]
MILKLRKPTINLSNLPSDGKSNRTTIEQNTGNLQFSLPVFLALLPCIHHQSDIITFQQNPPKLLPGLLLDTHLLRVIQNQIHVLVEPNDAALDSQILLLEKPYLDASFALKKPEDQVDGLGHYPLDFRARHG